MNLKHILTSKIALWLSVALAIISAGCETDSSSAIPDDLKLSVVATTGIVGDIVKVIGGDTIELNVLLPADSDPHSYEPAPQDIRLLTEADAIFMNGLGVEDFLDSILQNVPKSTQIFIVSNDVPLILLDSSGRVDEGMSGSTDPGDRVADPHVWFDPSNVAIWVRNIEVALTSLAPQEESVYGANALAYQDKLRELDSWILEQIDRVPLDQRKLVTDHDSLGYFALRYGFELIGTINPGYSTLIAPSANSLSLLIESIDAFEVKVLFVGTPVNSKLVDQLASETGVQIITIRTGSLSNNGGGSDTYLEFMETNIRAIVDGLIADEQ